MVQEILRFFYWCHDAVDLHAQLSIATLVPSGIRGCLAEVPRLASDGKLSISRVSARDTSEPIVMNATLELAMKPLETPTRPALNLFGSSLS